MNVMVELLCLLGDLKKQLTKVKKCVLIKWYAAQRGLSFVINTVAGE